MNITLPSGSFEIDPTPEIIRPKNCASDLVTTQFLLFVSCPKEGLMDVYMIGEKIEQIRSIYQYKDHAWDGKISIIEHGLG